TSSSTKRLPKFVDFTSVNQLALSWLTFDDPSVAQDTGPLTARPAHLHVLVLDALTGRKQGLQKWSTPSTPVRFLGVRDGKFLTCTGNVLRLFSPSFEVIREENLPSERACLNPFWSKAWGLSPSRRYLLLSSPLPQGYQNTLFDIEKFTAVANWPEKLRINDISDHWLVAYCGQQGEVCIRGMDQSWQPFRTNGLDKQMNDFKLKSPLFINDETLVIEAGNEMAVVEVDGKVLFQVGLAKKRSFGEPVRSGGGERFATIENRLRGLTNETLDMYAFPSNDRIVVYSIPDRRAIYAVKVKGASPWAPWEIHRNQVALSPDGVLLAVVSDRVLKVYRLPDLNSR
ncbi:MAG: hypothetical protein WA736_18840, partial [Candidatus Acidiferrum sp.]